MFAISGDVVVQTIGVVVVALIGSAGALAAAWWSRRSDRQMQPNGGSSLRDAVDLANRRLTTHDERLERMELAGVHRDAQLDRIVATVQAIHERQTGDDEVVEDPPSQSEG